MTTPTPRVLVVGDRFIEADLFAAFLSFEAKDRALPIDLELLQLPYPSVDSVPLPAEAPAAPFRPLWEDPSVVVARAEADLAADPTIREYTGPVDLLVPHLPGIDAVILHLAPLSRNAIAGADRLRAVGCARGGAVNLNMAALNERQIPVFNCPGRNARAVAEYVFGAVLALTRGIAAGAAAIADRHWRLDLYSYDRAGNELHGRTCGLIGFGGVGQALAPIARGFGMDLMVHDPYVEESVIREAGGEPDYLDEVLAESHVLVLAARLTDETRGMIGARQLRLLRPSCIFVNAARAELVDGAALREYLASHSISSAVIDVFSPEPPIAGDPLLSFDHVMLTPHIAGASQQAAERGAEVVCRNVVAFLADGSLDGSLNRDAILTRPDSANGDAR
jgi:D-3-phosphoglycerate dehydrogenase